MAQHSTGIVVALVSCCVSFTPTGASGQTGNTASPSNGQRARAILKEGLVSEDYKVRQEAITALGMIGRSEILLSRLEDGLHDKNVDVRLASVHALADFDSPQSEEALRKALQDQAPEVSFAAAKVLATVGDTAGKQALREVYQGKRKTRSSALKKEERSLVEEFHSTPSALIFIVTKGVGYVPVPGAGEGFSALSTLLRDPGVSDRASVLLILCRSKTPESRALLAEALQNEDWSVRAVAAQMIAHTAQTELREALPALFEDKHQKVRFRAAGAYLHLSMADKQGLPAEAKNRRGCPLRHRD